MHCNNNSTVYKGHRLSHPRDRYHFRSGGESDGAIRIRGWNLWAQLCNNYKND